MVRKLVGEGISERIAKATVQQCTDFPLDYDHCFMECLEWESNEREAEHEILSLAKDFDQEAGILTFFLSLAIYGLLVKINSIGPVLHSKSGFKFYLFTLSLQINSNLLLT